MSVNGEPKFSTALAPRSVDINIVYEKSGQKQPARSRRAGTAQRGVPIFSRRAVSARVSSRY